jgi:DnaJ-class molecular chaperone
MPKCPACNSTGYDTLSEAIPCAACEGAGILMGGPCPECSGSGAIQVDSNLVCGFCQGSGEVNFDPRD